MKEELSDTLQDTLLGLINSATQAADFVASEIPEVLEQLLMWKMWEGVAFITLGVIFLTAGGRLMKPTEKGWRGDYKSSNQDEFWGIFGTLGVVFGLGAGIIIVMVNTVTVIQIIVAPKVYLIEYAADLVK